MTAPLLEIRRAVRHFDTPAGRVRAVDDVSLSIQPGETLGLVGESGCGKSTLARLAMKLVPPQSGAILFEGDDVATANRATLARYRARMQMVFQDPLSALNPRESIFRILEQPLLVHRRGDRAARQARIAQLLQQVGLRPEVALRYPHELSGGQRQRVGIARALALEPRLLLCDEAVSALDVSVRAQVLNLLLRLRAELGLAALFISHDLAVVRHVADRVAVMYLGQVVEEAPRDALWQQPRHPYTRALMAATPVADPAEARARPPLPLQGELPDPIDPPAGCRFHPRCPMAEPRCRVEAPVLRAIAAGHAVACHRP
ncbi:peptide ABC transporter ATP-binding protein [Pseudoroseomonas deserti]|uniref:Glutathione import ATP-binding protein GsiA n=1 Tax=Teichococcus deserti TaxID=1817963 RepID=A0A1V2H6R6_9PROT|nr:oligopeptide/dipeptide ABC transporter ATP-binding protein [Pseudoroseomonas deserti]ONG57342.1 peptide ABC transporter ATP-binding protein [Pseudoroseomonas deserti]